jgi:hypothetical protein
MIRAEMERRLERLERQVADLPVAGTVPPELRAYLASLTPEQLEAVERVAALAYFAAPHALRPAERMSDAEAVEEWRRLYKRPTGGWREQATGAHQA